MDPSTPVAAAAALAGGAALSVTLTPVAIRLAPRLGMLDSPSGHKAHARPTPLLGGVAVVATIITVVGVLEGSEWLASFLLLAALCAVGTLDDRIGLGATSRIVVVLVAAVIASADGKGWSVFDSAPFDLALTALFVLATVNAINLMDNLDGAASVVVGTTALALGSLHLTAEGGQASAVLALAVAGACGGFLLFNLRAPSRIFLGDGGSMPLGLAIALVVMASPGPMAESGGGDLGLTLILVAVLFVGLPAFDTALVIRSRTRRGVSVFTGGRDHLTHRLLPLAGSPRRVALWLTVAQLCCAGLAWGLYGLGGLTALPVVVGVFMLGAFAIEAIDRPVVRHGSLKVPVSRAQTGISRPVPEYRDDGMA